MENFGKLWEFSLVDTSASQEIVTELRSMISATEQGMYYNCVSRGHCAIRFLVITLDFKFKFLGVPSRRGAPVTNTIMLILATVIFPFNDGGARLDYSVLNNKMDT